MWRQLLRTCKRHKLPISTLLLAAVAAGVLLLTNQAVWATPDQDMLHQTVPPRPRPTDSGGGGGGSGGDGGGSSGGDGGSSALGGAPGAIVPLAGQAITVTGLLTATVPLTLTAPVSATLDVTGTGALTAPASSDSPAGPQVFRTPVYAPAPTDEDLGGAPDQP